MAPFCYKEAVHGPAVILILICLCVCASERENIMLLTCGTYSLISQLGLKAFAKM